MQAVPLSNFKIFPSANCSSFETCPTSIGDRKIPRMTRADGSRFCQTVLTSLTEALTTQQVLRTTLRLPDISLQL